MSRNEELAQLFSEIAQLLELTGGDKFRISAHARTARIIEDESRDLVALAQKTGGREELLAIEGIGAKTADKIAEFAATGRIVEHDELAEKVPGGLLDLLRIPGLGPKTVKAMWDSLHITSMADLKKAIEDGSILKLPRMGAKTVENIKASIEFAAKSADRTPIGLAYPIAETIAARLAALKGVKHAEPAGSLRRGKETIGDLDFIVAAKDADLVREAFTTMPEVTQVLANGETKASVRLDVSGRAIQADLRVVPPEHYGSALLYFTGSKEHNVRLRERALKAHQTLNDYGLFPDDKEKNSPHLRGIKPVASVTEESIYKALGLAYWPPELREDQPLSEEEPPQLIELADIKAELHAHTTASDGRMSIEELALLAKARGFHTVAVTDHSQSSVIANGLKPDRLRKHIDAVREADAKVKGITILAGSEVDILSDGRLDYDDDLLAELDIVVASPHAALKQEPEKATARMLAAVKHPLVHIIGHPTGRLVGRREGFHPDIAALAEAAAEHHTALEINANWMRLDLRDTHVAIAMKAGALLAINCDTHLASDADNLRYGVITGRRGGLTAERCINTWTAAKLHKWLKAKR